MDIETTTAKTVPTTDFTAAATEPLTATTQSEDTGAVAMETDTSETPAALATSHTASATEPLTASETEPNTTTTSSASADDAAGAHPDTYPGRGSNATDPCRWATYKGSSIFCTISEAITTANEQLETKAPHRAMISPRCIGTIKRSPAISREINLACKRGLPGPDWVKPMIDANHKDDYDSGLCTNQLNVDWSQNGLKAKEGPIKAGDLIELHGLITKEEWNGLRGLATTYNIKTGLWKIEIGTPFVAPNGVPIFYSNHCRIILRGDLSRPNNPVIPDLGRSSAEVSDDDSV
jgi:hypothetical protein